MSRAKKTVRLVPALPGETAAAARPRFQRRARFRTASENMRAAVIDAAGAPPRLTQLPSPVPAEGEVRVSLHSAGLNHRDLWIQRGAYPNIKYPVVPGSDGVGIIESVGPGVDAACVGRQVIICPSLNWGDNPRVPGSDWSILCLPGQGTFAEKICVPVENAVPRPLELSWNECAALPVAALTAYRALFTRARLGYGERLLITGAGGGVAQFLLQFAVAAGVEVYVTSSSHDKIEKSVALGAKGGALYTDQDWATHFLGDVGGFDAIIDGASGNGLNDLATLCKAGGRIIHYGATRGNPSPLIMRTLFWKQIDLLGTTLGNPAEFRAMLEFVTHKKLRPSLAATYPLAQVASAFALLESGTQFGKVVLQVES